MTGRRRVLVTGVGVVSPIGCDKEAFAASLAAAKSGVSRLKADFASQMGVSIAAQVDFDATAYFPKPKIATIDRFSQFALVAARQAIADAGLGPGRSERAGVYLGSSMGGSSTFEEAYVALFRANATRLRPLTVTMVMPNAAASHIAMEFGLRGPALTFSAACASSSIAIGEAFRLIRHGYGEIMLAGGSEAMLTYGVIRAWESLSVLANEWTDDPAASCRPFSADRTGLVLGEGAAVLVLEDMETAVARGAHAYAEIVGYASNSDATHITKPDVIGQSRVMVEALRDADLSPKDVDYINAHATATLAGDKIETAAIKHVFGDAAYEIPVSSTKSTHGHLLGASGAVELLAAILAIERGVIPPTAHFGVGDPECDLDYVPNAARTNQDVDIVISNSFAFGGSNATLVAREFRH
jgi:3-oxoacyl-[acyl-carrier-protein] synthase II